MMKLLLADDDKTKCNRIITSLKQVFPQEYLLVHTAHTIHDAAELMTQVQFDLLILDINIPQRLDEEPQADGGIQFLRQLTQNSRGFNKPRYIVGLTAFNEKFDAYRKEFEDRMWHLLLYSEALDAWSDKLTVLMLHIWDSQARGNQEYKTDIAIITAREDVELEGVLNLAANWQKLQVAGDSTIYHTGAFTGGRVSLSVAAAAALEMGMPASTALAMKMIERFRPRFLIMAGIAAGIEGSFGDILVADVAFDYGSGKLKASKTKMSLFAPDPHPIPLDPSMKAKLAYFIRQPGILDSIRAKAMGGAVPDKLQVHIGPMASGAAVVQDRSVVEKVQSLWRKLVGVEMETYGVYVAARLCTDPKPIAMSAKSICDFADPDKADHFQRYAAFTSANFIYEFAIKLLVPLSPSS